MKVVLRSAVADLGDSGDIVDVADGYGRNYLIPQGLAIRATAGAEREAESMRRARTARHARDLAAAREFAAKIASTPLTIAARASEEGKLFGSVTENDIVAAAAQLGVEIERNWVEIEEPIKQLSTVTVPIKLHPEVVSAMNVTVIADVD